GPIEVVPGGFAYSQLSMIGKGEVGLLFEGAGYAQIALLRLDLKDLLIRVEAELRPVETPPSGS
ncbi:MAG: hypothetical protein O3A31_00920, partial [Planctomycetota bacterium]|nr:hypothetical protein [Planctomycetota bacterium]